MKVVGYPETAFLDVTLDGIQCINESQRHTGFKRSDFDWAPNGSCFKCQKCPGFN
jgi:hypothetical protein